MNRAWCYLMAPALAAAVSAVGCAPETKASTAPVQAPAAAQSVFVDLGNGLVYDETLDITWLQDANYAKTSGYDADGVMTFDEASTWASTLVFGGTDGWRLPTFDHTNPRPQTATSDNEIGSLLGALTAGHFTWPHPADTTPFINIDLESSPEPVYWTGAAGDPGFVWDYYMTCG